MCYTTESYEDDVSVLRQINPNIIALDEKTLEAERRSYHTFFDVHVVETRDGYILIEEGDYAPFDAGIARSLLPWRTAHSPASRCTWSRNGGCMPDARSGSHRLRD